MQIWPATGKIFYTSCISVLFNFSAKKSVIGTAVQGAAIRRLGTRTADPGEHRRPTWGSACGQTAGQKPQSNLYSKQC